MCTRDIEPGHELGLDVAFGLMFPSRNNQQAYLILILFVVSFGALGLFSSLNNNLQAWFSLLLLCYVVGT